MPEIEKRPLWDLRDPEGSRNYRWFRWFAWYPVRLGDFTRGSWGLGPWVWLRWIERSFGSSMIDGTLWAVYRYPGN